MHQVRLWARDGRIYAGFYQAWGIWLGHRFPEDSSGKMTTMRIATFSQVCSGRTLESV
jgi:hypothetical protein